MFHCHSLRIAARTCLLERQPLWADEPRVGHSFLLYLAQLCQSVLHSDTYSRRDKRMLGTVEDHLCIWAKQAGRRTCYVLEAVRVVPMSRTHRRSKGGFADCHSQAHI